MFNDYNKNFNMETLIKSMENKDFRPSCNQAQFIDLAKKFKLHPHLLMDYKSKPLMVE